MNKIKTETGDVLSERKLALALSLSPSAIRQQNKQNTVIVKKNSVIVLKCIEKQKRPL